MKKLVCCDASGHYHQLNALTCCRLKTSFTARYAPSASRSPGETPIVALHESGVEYIEVRCMDLNPYLPAGIDADTAHFIEAFLIVVPAHAIVRPADMAE
jgi:glutamate--cysteine ligase